MTVNELYNQIISPDKITQEQADAICDSYPQTDQGVADFLSDLASYSKGELLIQIMLASKFYEDTKNIQCLTFMLEIIQNKQLPYMFTQNIYRQVVIKFFRDNTYLDYKKDYFYYQKLYKRFIEEIDINIFKPYIPTKDTVVILVHQFLASTHAPTARADYYGGTLQKNFNKKVTMAITQELPKYTKFFTAGTASYSEDNLNGINKIKLNSGETVSSYQADNNNYTLDEMKSLLSYIYYIKPELVLVIGERSIIGDVCSNFTKVVVDTLSSEIPICIAENILVEKYMMGDAAKIKYFTHKKKHFIVKPLPKFNYNRLPIPALKQEYGIDPDCFAIALVGNRLEIELTPEYTKMLEDILKIDSRVHFVIIGEFEKYTYFYNNLDILENSTILGYQKNLKRALSMCNLYLNPPRKGGGMAAIMALSERVPVVTLPKCDVEMNIGSDFTAQLDEYVEVVRKYVLDKEFYKSKQEDIEKLVTNNTYAPEDGVQFMKYMLDEVEKISL
ncbi:MAG: hypothetical protein BEN19_00320 [Epulopiscium sp. Nuni2H_MBin003]|nr:MAG: hypothetical protein BEN19_00320 [Epulopiscium sp. Nuni2H_MBin003]